MASSTESDAPRRWDSSDRAVVQAEALDVLSDALLWQLAEPRWGEIEQVLAAMAAALESGDMDAFATATADLELAGPFRITPIGTATGPTPAIRDLLNQLVHSVGGVTAERSPQEPPDREAGNADASRD
jgi:hypothetical protein